MKKNKIVLVVGANGLIGKNICASLIKDNFKVIGVDNSYPLHKSKQIKFRNKKQINFKLDVSMPNEVNDFFKKNDYILRNLHGMIYGPTVKTEDFYNEFEKFSFKSWKKILNTELDGAFNFSQNLGKIVKKNKKGSIIFLSSIYSVVTNDNRIYTNTNISRVNSKTNKKNTNLYSSIAYPVSKNGLIAITKYLAGYWGKYSVRVNAISPGSVERNKKIREDKVFLKRYLNKVPLNRRAQIKEISSVIKFLLSEDSSYITGQNIIVDGGYTIW
jgi:NAD(P)-dependent dehydrogenase (short-subunit alcohol dehydrogenase family)